MNKPCTLCDDPTTPDNPFAPIRSRGKIVFTILQGTDEGEGYARWISQRGLPNGRMPDYSIQRFNYKADRFGRGSTTEVPAYYRCYYRGMTVGFKLNREREWATFEDAANACDIHFHTNRDD